MRADPKLHRLHMTKVPMSHNETKMCVEVSFQKKYADQTDLVYIMYPPSTMQLVVRHIVFVFSFSSGWMD